MPNARWSFVAASLLVSVALVPFAGPSSASEVLALAGFDSDATGATARPGGPPTVTEEVYDASDTTEGVSAVEVYGAGKRYRLSDVGSDGGTRGIHFPFTRNVSTGTLSLTATVSAAQFGNGGVLSVVRPDEEEWPVGVSFAANGTFRVHGNATTFAYAVGTSYRVDVTVTFGSPTTADYAITDLSQPSRVFTLEGCPVAGVNAAGALRFATSAVADGSFSVDEVEAWVE